MLFLVVFAGSGNILFTELAERVEYGKYDNTISNNHKQNNNTSNIISNISTVLLAMTILLVLVTSALTIVILQVRLGRVETDMTHMDSYLYSLELDWYEFA